MNKKTAKGISRRVVAKAINHDNYEACLQDDYNITSLPMTKIHSINHSLYTSTLFKKGLSPYNDKLFIDKEMDEYTTHSFGYKNSES